MVDNDYELVFLSQEGNEDARNQIITNYKPIIIKKSKDAFCLISHHGIEINDIMQEAYIALNDAIDKYEQSNETLFYTFANLCIERRITNYIKKNTSKKDRILNDAVYIDDGIENFISDESNMEEFYVQNDDRNHIIADVIKKFTSFERKVFELKEKGYTNKEIAHTLNKSVKSVYNTCQRIKEKLKKYMMEIT